jgi:hypothetical protein
MCIRATPARIFFLAVSVFKGIVLSAMVISRHTGSFLCWSNEVRCLDKHWAESVCEEYENVAHLVEIGNFSSEILSGKSPQ